MEINRTTFLESTHEEWKTIESYFVKLILKNGSNRTTFYESTHEEWKAIEPYFMKVIMKNGNQ
jgi:hypothetical protein